MKSRISIPELDFEYKLWKNRLRFYEQETKIYLARLLSIKVQDQVLADQYTLDLKDIILKVQSLDREIRIHEEEIACYKKDYPINFQHVHYQDLESIRHKFRNLTRAYLALIDRIDASVHEVHLA